MIPCPLSPEAEARVEETRQRCARVAERGLITWDEAEAIVNEAYHKEQRQERESQCSP